MDNKLYKISEVAERFRVTSQTIRNRIKAGKFPPDTFIIAYGKVLFNEKVFSVLEDKRKQTLSKASVKKINENTKLILLEKVMK